MNSVDKFDTEKVQQAAKLFEGFHDFRTFMANPRNINGKKITRRLINVSDFRPAVRLSNFGHCEHDFRVEYWDFYFESKGFLYNQVS